MPMLSLFFTADSPAQRERQTIKARGMYSRLLCAFASTGLAWASFAAAQTAITTEAVTVRAAPDRHFPPVTWLLGGASVTVVGCVESWRWCDVTAGRDRGWVYTRYLAITSGGSTVTILNDGPGLGLPMVTFSLDPYWDSNYRGRPWFSKQPYWQNRWQRRPPEPAWRPTRPR